MNESKDKSAIAERGLPPRGKGKMRKARLRKSKDNEYVEFSSCEMLSHVVGSVGEGRRRERGRVSAHGLQEASISTSTSKFMPNADLSKRKPKTDSYKKPRHQAKNSTATEGKTQRPLRLSSNKADDSSRGGSFVGDLSEKFAAAFPNFRSALYSMP